MQLNSPLILTCLLAGSLAMVGCASISPSPNQARSDAQALLAKRDRALANPQALATRYTESLERFGRLLAVYRKSSKAPIYVQSRSIGDATGLSNPLVGAELPSDITEMVRSAVNRIGESVVYVPFQPDYVLAQAQQGASMRLTLPNVVITGAITEFDRALTSAGRGGDLSLMFGKGNGASDSSVARKGTSTISRMGLDLNLMDFASQSMIPQIQATNSMQVLNETSEDSFNFAIYGNGFGLTTNTRYLQGRHNAMRLLVDLSIVQLLGRYANVPYWRCLPNAAPDATVQQRVARNYESKDTTTRIKWMQDTLRDYGFPLRVNGVMDLHTRTALDSVIKKMGWQNPKDPLAPQLFVQLFSNVPIGQG